MPIQSSTLISFLAPDVLLRRLNSRHQDQAWATASNPPDRHFFLFLFVKGIHVASTLGILFSLIDVGSVLTACVVFLFFYHQQWRAGEGESGRPGAWKTTPQIPTNSAYKGGPRGSSWPKEPTTPGKPGPDSRALV
eukprot:1150515-Pelagomonas_calceolata.AAC.8